MPYLVLIVLVLKHFAADYLMQTGWMISGKGRWQHLGGYAHAGVHGLGTFLVLLPFGLGAGFVMAVALAEFALHYLLDHGKEHLSHGIDPAAEPRRFWAYFGLDQTLHSLTYVGIVVLVDMRMGGAL
jgi:Protein of unknown function (DUF3307).